MPITTWERTRLQVRSIPTHRTPTSYRSRAAAFRTQHRPAPYDREEVLSAWSRRCMYCDSPAEHIEHVTPLCADSGSDTRERVGAACADCNADKGSQSLAQWALSWL